jgi:predicted PurR-regulated permease PerM
MMRTRRVIRERPHRAGNGEDGAEFVELAPEELSGVFAAPSWLRDLGMMSWLLVGVTVLLVGLVWLMALTNAIVIPVITATIVAAVLAPVVRYLSRHMPRAAAAALVFLAVIVVGVLVVLLVIGGITSQADTLESSLKSGAQKIQGWLQDAGVSSSGAQQANADASNSVSDAFHALLSGVGAGVRALASLAVFLSFAALSLFFLLKDGPKIRAWIEAHMGVPHAVGHTVSGRTLQALRGYFAGVTAVAAFNGIVIGLGAVVLDVPHAGSIAAVNFAAAYIPYLGAWSAGAFTVLIALGAKGSTTALVMALIVLLANGVLQQLIQPIAYGAALGIHPLAVLIVTIAGGSLFGTIGLVLAAPLTSAATHISADHARARAGAPPGAG